MARIRQLGITDLVTLAQGKKKKKKRRAVQTPQCCPLSCLPKSLLSYRASVQIIAPYTQWLTPAEQSQSNLFSLQKPGWHPGQTLQDLSTEPSFKFDLLSSSASSLSTASSLQQSQERKM